MAMALSEDPIREALVTDGSPWRDVRCYPVVDSTNAASLADPRPWRVVTCGHQRSGRGRHSRAWSSPPGTSVALSLTVPMPASSTAWGWLPLVTGLAVLDGLGEVVGAPERFTLKWPNDVLVRGEDERWGKVCGILCETAPGPDGPLVVAGVGVNLALGAADLPVPSASSLTLAGFPAPDGGDVVVAVARAFARWHEAWYAGSPAQLRAAYVGRCDTIGRDVEVHLPGGSIARGRATDVAEGGELLVAVPEPGGTGSAGGAGDASGGRLVRRAYAAGDVIHLRPQPERGAGAAPAPGRA